ncbi:MAG: monovalent cation/H+ antiporter complex subunit F [Dehalococcoidia bacterium]
MNWLPALIVLAICVVICLVRVFVGPGAPTRLVAFDTTNTVVVASLVIAGMMFNQVIYIDVAIVYAVLSYVMTLYVAKYIQGDKF